MAPPIVKNLKNNSNKNGKADDSNPKPSAKPASGKAGKPESDKKRTPDFNVYAIVSGRDKNYIGSQIGKAFNHNSGGGLNIYLDAVPIPVDGKIQLVAYAPKS